MRCKAASRNRSRWFVFESTFQSLCRAQYRAVYALHHLVSRRESPAAAREMSYTKSLVRSSDAMTLDLHSQGDRTWQPDFYQPWPKSPRQISTRTAKIIHLYLDGVYIKPTKVGLSHHNCSVWGVLIKNRMKNADKLIRLQTRSLVSAGKHIARGSSTRDKRCQFECINR